MKAQVRPIVPISPAGAPYHVVRSRKVPTSVWILFVVLTLAVIIVIITLNIVYSNNKDKF
jgi:hypothetical protein